MIRREFLSVMGGSACSLAAGTSGLYRAAGDSLPWAGEIEEIEKRAARLIREYDSQGIHRTATAVDDASARWLGRLVEEAGANMTMTRFKIDRVDPIAAYVSIGERRIEGLPIYDGGFTDAGGFRGTLGPIESDAEIGLAEAPPNAEYGPAYSKMRRETRHRAIVLITTGTMKGLSPINGSEFRHPYGPPVLQVSSSETEFLREKAAARAQVHFTAHIRRTLTRAFNVIGIVGGRNPNLKPLVVITPRSGWWQCASERGGGLACWLEVMRTLAAARPARDCHFLASSGHEIGHLGLDHFLDTRTDLVKDARAWLHFGANIGAASQPFHRLQCSDDALESLAMSEFDRAGAAIGEKVARNVVPFGEAGNIHRRGGHYLSVVGRSNGYFHHPDDRWPATVDIKMVARFASAFSQIALKLAGE